MKLTVVWLHVFSVPSVVGFVYSLVISDLVSDLFSFEMFACVKGDVYPIEPLDSFTVNQVLDAHWGVLNQEDVSWFIVTHCP